MKSLTFHPYPLLSLHTHILDLLRHAYLSDLLIFLDLTETLG
jgi:hypothetical protein